jgi:hypothetical protein
VTLHVPANDLVASTRVEFADSFGSPSEPMQVRTITLDDLLAREGIARVDFLTMDIELAEPAALAGFSIDRFRPAVVCIEAQPEVRQAILEYFHNHGYILLGKYLRADTSNLWFAPFNPTVAIK